MRKLIESDRSNLAAASLPSAPTGLTVVVK